MFRQFKLSFLAVDAVGHLNTQNVRNEATGQDGSNF
jgi:hypothetical protein